MTAIATPEQALEHWSTSGPLSPVPRPGLINRSWLVGAPPVAVLQWVSPIFDRRIHLDIFALTERLASRGLETPRLVPTREGELSIDGAEQGCWRLLTYVPGETVDNLEGPSRAAAAGRRVGLFHAALSDWDYRFCTPPRRMHDTPARMRDLELAVTEASSHPLITRARALAAEILDGWASWQGELGSRERPCHGDLKISNLRFEPVSGEAIALVDLDTIGLQTLSAELGDAWRSWTNRRGEDDPASVLDLELFEASATAWLEHGPRLDRDERRGLASGVERIALELAARFAADGVRNRYFREDRSRFPAPGEHNLERARGQLAFARSARSRRKQCERIIGARR